MWYRKHIGGDQRCPIVDTWWQTETGGIMISPLPGVTAAKPGSAQRPIPGIGAPRSSTTRATRWGMARRRLPRPDQAVAGDAARHLGRPGALQVDTYWSRWPAVLLRRRRREVDDDGNIWLLGRVDDVMNVSGHRLSTTEIESALVSHPKVAEAAVVGANDEMTGQAVVAFVILRGGDVDGQDGAAIVRRSCATTWPTRSGRSPSPARSLGSSCRARAAEDPLRQDHAPPAARRRREPQHRRRDDPRRLVGDGPHQVVTTGDVMTPRSPLRSSLEWPAADESPSPPTRRWRLRACGHRGSGRRGCADDPGWPRRCRASRCPG
jgi:hypothetical protein